jgi:hypothetical protein
MKKILLVLGVLAIGSAATAMESRDDNELCITFKRVINSIASRLDKIESNISKDPNDTIKKEFDALNKFIETNNNVIAKYVLYDDYLILHNRVKVLEEKTNNSIKDPIASTSLRDVFKRKSMPQNSIVKLQLPENYLNKEKLPEQPTDPNLTSKNSWPFRILVMSGGAGMLGIAAATAYYFLVYKKNLPANNNGAVQAMQVPTHETVAEPLPSK